MIKSEFLWPLSQRSVSEGRHWVLAAVAEVGVASLTHADLMARAVFEDEYVVVVPNGHALGVPASISLRQLDGQRMWLSAGGCETLIQELLAPTASHPEVVCLVRTT